VALKEGRKIGSLFFVFCSDDDLLELNEEYLNHNTLTDILTFPYSQDPIEADIYISLERVSENADLYSEGNKLKELLRVMVHGLLHMCNYNDHSRAGKSEMRTRETLYLDAYSSFENQSNLE